MTQSRFNAFDLSPAGARHRGAATLAVLALAAALLAGGCGSSDGTTRLSKAQYQARIQKDGDDLREAFKPLNTPPASLDELAKNLKAGQEKLRSAADDLDAVTPPSEVEKDNDLLVAGLRKLADNLDPLRRGAEKNDLEIVRKAIEDLEGSRALIRTRQAIEDMKKKGYDLGSLGG